MECVRKREVAEAMEIHGERGSSKKERHSEGEMSRSSIEDNKIGIKMRRTSKNTVSI